MKCEAFALAATVVTPTAFQQDTFVLTGLVSILVSTAALASSNRCVPTHWEWSQLPDLDFVSRFSYEEDTGFPSEYQEQFAKIRHYFLLLF